MNVSFIDSESVLMQWQKPEMREVSLAMEVTAYVNVDQPRRERRETNDADQTHKLPAAV